MDPSEIAKGKPPNPKNYDKNSDGIITLFEWARNLADKRTLRRELGIEAVDTNSPNILPVRSVIRSRVDRQRPPYGVFSGLAIGSVTAAEVPWPGTDSNFSDPPSCETTLRVK